MQNQIVVAGHDSCFSFEEDKIVKTCKAAEIVFYESLKEDKIMKY